MAAVNNTPVIKGSGSAKSGPKRDKLFVERQEERAKSKKVEWRQKQQKSVAVQRMLEEKEELGKHDGVREFEEEQKGDKVVHPWYLNTVRHVYVEPHKVIVEGKDHQGVFDVATHEDNLTGKGLLRYQAGEGHYKIPESWRSEEYIKKACAPLVTIAVGKTDFELRLMVPMAIQNLKNFVEPWPTAQADIIEYLLSPEFGVLVQKFQTNRLNNYDSVIRSRALKYGAEIGASTTEVDGALAMFKGAWVYNHWFGVLLGLYCEYLCYALKSKMFDSDPVVDHLKSYNVLFVKVIFPVVIGCLGTLILMFYVRLTVNTRRILNALTESNVKINYGSVAWLKATCSKGLKLPDLLSCWKFSLTEGEQWKPCKEKKPYDSFGLFIKGATMVIPSGCHHDQYNGLCIRYFFERTVEKLSIDRCVEAAKRVSSKLSAEWILYSYDEWVHHLAGKRRRLLEDEPEANHLKNQVPVDIFVKMEAYLGKSEEAFKPRIIQGRRLGYQNIVGPYFYSVSKWLGKAFGPSGNLIYDSGLDALELGQIAMKCFSKKKVFEIDVSNWDGSLAPEWLSFEMWFIENVLPHLPPRWYELKRYWRNVEGVGKEGVSFKTCHGRRSGDMWTSCFNSLINLCILCWIFGEENIIAVAKGDDNFFGANTDLSASDIVALYAKIGMKAKVKEVHHISELGYCSGTFWPVKEGWKWGVLPFRILSKFGLNLHRHPKKLHTRLLYGTALSMLPIAGHVPLIGTLLRGLVSDGNWKDIKPIMGTPEEWRTTSSTVDEIEPLSYNLMAHRYQLSMRDIEMMDVSMRWNLKKNRPLSLNDFPMVVDDYRFRHGFGVDCDAEISDCRNVEFVDKEEEKPAASRISEFFWAVVFSPLAEEWIRSLLPIAFSIFIGILEASFYNQIFPLIVHFGLFLCTQMFGFYAALFAHFVFNLCVFLGRCQVGYGSVSMVLRHFWVKRSGREEQICSGLRHTVRLLDKYRLDVFSTKRSHRILSCAAKLRSKNVKNKTKNSQNKTSKKNRAAKGSLGRNLLKGGLGALGSYFGPAGLAVGSSLGDWGANILGMGDYEVKKNTVLEGNGVPSMHKTNRGIIISHKEYLGDITGSIGFTSRNYVLNPGSPNTFPWLSNIAAMFQSYKFRGLAFEFNSTSADALNSVNTALGTVVMATQYNVSLPLFLNKAEMEQYEYTTAGRPSRNLLHCVECDPSLQVMDHLYTRTGALPAGQDYQFYDWGNFQLATVGMQAAATIGELWVTYEVEFLKPRIASGGAWPGDFTRINNGPYSTNDPLGSIQTNPVGTLGVTVTAGASGFQRITFPASITAGRFLVQVSWVGGSGVTVTYPTRTLSNMTASNFFGVGASSSEFFGPQNPSGGAVSACSYTGVYTINGYSNSGSYIELGSAGTLPTASIAVTVSVVALPLVDSYF